jgi:hypothetical protein
MLDWIVILLSAALSVVLPVAIIYVRQTVKTQRQDVINDLAAIFEPGHGRAGREQIIPSFEFVKFKYSVAEAPSLDHGNGQQTGKAAAPDRDFSKTMFVVSSIPLMAVLFALGVVAFGALLTLVARNHGALGWVKQFPVFTPKGSDAIEGLDTWLAMLAVAYIASYLYNIRELLRAVANFELSPMTLLMSAIHVLFGVATALILASVAADVLGLGGAVTTSALLLAAFAVGFVPELGVRTLLRATKLKIFKSVDEDVYKTFSVTPVEVIDGIDTEVCSRLSLHNIVSVQNLATANPIMLFVETPYGVYQIIDWVAQAQLCSALGPKAVIEFWKLGIRTIFDLERALIGASSTRALRHEVGKIVVLARSPEERERLGRGERAVGGRRRHRAGARIDHPRRPAYPEAASDRQPDRRKARPAEPAPDPHRGAMEAARPAAAGCAGRAGRAARRQQRTGHRAAAANRRRCEAGAAAGFSRRHGGRSLARDSRARHLLPRRRGKKRLGLNLLRASYPGSSAPSGQARGCGAS